MKSISLVIPIYNEGDLIQENVPKCLSALSADFSDFEIILVDDGSVKHDADLMDSLAKIGDNVRVIHNAVNLGLGISIQRGFAEAKKDIIVFNSIDLPLDPADIKPLIEKMLDNDMLILERYKYAGAALFRKIASKINFFLLKILYPLAGKGIRDFNYTFFVKRDVLAGIMPTAKSSGFTQPEMILKARRNKHKVISLPVEYHPRLRGTSKIGTMYNMFHSLYDMMRFRLFP